MDNLKNAFSKVKQDINILKEEVKYLAQAIRETRVQLVDICQILQNLHKKNENLEKEQKSLLLSQKESIPTQKPLDSTHNELIPAHNSIFKPLNAQNLSISTGNGGVPTDRQTHQQTDNPTQNNLRIQQNPVENVTKILNSLDNLKKEVRLKFRRLTDQEMLIFSTIYQLEEERGFSDYKTVAEKLKLTESSIRDYVGRLLKKGIPLDKDKINNKTIHLKVSENLKKIAPLSTIIQLRGL